MKKLFITLTLTLAFISCKNDKAKTGTNGTDKKKQEIKKVTEKEDIYRVEFKGVFTEDGLISMNYLDDASQQFNGKQYVFKRIKGSEDSQSILIELPKKVYLEKFRFHPNFKSKEKGEIKIDEIKISVNEKEIIVNPSNMLTYFKPNIFVRMTKDDPVIRFKTLERDGKNLFSPYIISNKKLTEALLEL